MDEKTQEEKTRELQEALAAPFPPEDVDWLPKIVSGDGTKALALAYIDARAVQDRLDQVMGMASWRDRYDVLPDGNVMCHLSLRIENEWIVKSDVGGVSEQKDSGDKRKASISDALKRAAVKWGIGRYLYGLGGQWVPYDSQKKRFTKRPTLPDRALPKGYVQEGRDREERAPRSTSKPAAQPQAVPANGAELKNRLLAFQERLEAAGLCKKGELLAHVLSFTAEYDLPPDIAEWCGDVLRWATDESKAFEKLMRDERDKRLAAKEQNTVKA